MMFFFLIEEVSENADVVGGRGGQPLKTKAHFGRRSNT